MSNHVTAQPNRSVSVKRKHWGEFTDDITEPKRELKSSDMVSAKTKLEYLKKLQVPKPVQLNQM